METALGSVPLVIRQLTWTRPHVGELLSFDILFYVESVLLFRL